MVTKEEYERDIKEAYAKGYFAALDSLRAGYQATLELLKIPDPTQHVEKRGGILDPEKLATHDRCVHDTNPPSACKHCGPYLTRNVVDALKLGEGPTRTKTEIEACLRHMQFVRADDPDTGQPICDNCGESTQDAGDKDA